MSRHALFFALASLAACVTPGTHPDDMSAAGHRAAAVEHHETGERRDSISTPIGPRGSAGPWQGLDATGVKGAPHHAIGEAHERAALAVDAEYASACTGVVLEDQRLSPLEGSNESVRVIPGGAAVRVEAKGRSAGQLAAALRCHRAWMAREGLEHSASCPLAAHGATFDVVEATPALDVLITAPDATQGSEIVRRAAALVGGKGTTP